MIKIVTNEHYSLISRLFEESNESIKIISPFLSKRMAELLCEASRRGVNCSFITRFYLQDFIDGSNTLEGLQNMLDVGVKLYALIGLHTKLYLFDSFDSIVGSANFTEAGLKRNIELSIYLNKEKIIDELNGYYDDFLSIIEKADDGIITQEMLDDFKEKYRRERESKKSLDGGTRVMAVVRGAALDRTGKDIKENIHEALNDIKEHTGERLSDVVYGALGGRKEEASYKVLRNIILKFSSSAKSRADGNKPMEMHSFIDNGKIIYISNFSEAKKKSATKIEEGDETFFCVHSYDKEGNECPLIVGKGYFRAFDNTNDIRLKRTVSVDALMDYPIYCVISEAKVIDAPINCGIPLRELIDHLGYKTYMHTREKPEKYPPEKVAISHGQQAMLALTPEAKEYLDKRLDELGKQYGWKKYQSE